MSNAQMAREAQKFLNSMLAATKFAQAVMDYELTDNAIVGARADLDRVKNEILTAKEEVLRAQQDLDAAKLAKKAVELKAEQVLADANVYANKEVAAANYQAEQIVMQAENEAKTIVAAAVAEKSKKLGEIDTLNGLIEDGKKELAKVEKALADLKKKFG